MEYKKRFYSKLEECYLGVKIKDFHQNNTAKSGFSNLLHIKEQYFGHIKDYLKSQIASEPQSHDIYNKLFTFFDSYLSESGTPFFTDTPIYKNIYAKVYSNTKDTSLFYKTQNLYYVKSDTLYQSLTLSDDSETYQVYFDAKQYRQNADNSKSKLLFKLHSINRNEGELPTITIKVLSQKDLFPELNNVFKQNSNEFSDEFLKSLKDAKLKINEENLKKIFRSYKKQSEIDFFIHKNAKAFLEEQFNLWMFSYLYKDSEIQEWNPDKIAYLQRIKNIAYEIISLIADFENELKAIWLKPKFAKKVEYVFSLDMLLKHSALSGGNSSLTQSSQELEKSSIDRRTALSQSDFSAQPVNLTQDTRIAGNAERSQKSSLDSENSTQISLLDSILNDKGFESQIKEWQELKLIDEGFKKEDLLIGAINGDSPACGGGGGRLHNTGEISLSST